MHTEQLYHKHIATLQSNTAKSLEDFALPGLVISAGHLIEHYEDDITFPFHANHHFRHWCPAKGPNHVLVIGPTAKPQLLAYQPDDYWNAIAQVGANSYWVPEMDILPFSDLVKLWAYVKKTCSGFALHGPLKGKAEDFDLLPIPSGLLSHLNWQRAYKTDFEVFCLEEATKLAALGHQAARNEFLAGGSELDIYYHYLMAMRTIDADLPYEAIVGLDQNAAIIHYHWKDDNHRNAKVMLIDAGAQHNNYAADITRTYARVSAHPVFISLLAAVNKAQLKLCSEVMPGVSNNEINFRSQCLIADILQNHGIVKGLSTEAMVSEKMSFDFYPHGVGHLLGIHVHDVGGKLLDKSGTIASPDAAYPYLRSTRVFEPGFYLTVEPGLYFVDILLNKRRKDPSGKHFNWNLINELRPFGGIRIEDNVLVTKDGCRNITREHFGDHAITF